MARTAGSSSLSVHARFTTKRPVWSTLAEGYYVSAEYEKALRAAEQALALARKRKASPVDIWNYTEQLKKCKQAVDAMALLD